MEGNLETIFTRWINQSTSPVVAKLKCLIDDQERLEQNLFVFAHIDDEEQREIKKIPYALRNHYGVVFKDAMKKITVWKNQSHDLIKSIKFICDTMGINLFDLQLHQKIEDPYLFLKFMEVIINDDGIYYFQRNNHPGKRLLYLLEKQIEIIQIADNPELDSIEIVRVKKFRQNLIEFELKINTLISKFVKQANRHNLDIPEVEINCERPFKYICQTGKYELFAELLWISSPSIKELLFNLLSSKIQLVEDKAIVDWTASLLDSNLYNKQLFSYLQNYAMRPDEFSGLYWQKSNFVSTSNKLYIKFIPSNFESVVRFKPLPAGGIFQRRDPTEEERLKQAITSRLQHIMEVIQAIATKKQIYLCENSTSFAPISQNEKKELIKLCYFIAYRCAKDNSSTGVKSFVAQKMRSPSFITYSTIIFQEMADWGEEELFKCFLDFTGLLDIIIYQGTNDINLLNNQEFLTFFAKLVSKFFQKQSAASIINFVTSNLLKLIEFGIDQNLLPIRKLHSLKLQQWISAAQNIFQEDSKDSLSIYLDNFPECYEIFAEESKQILRTAIDEIKNKNSFYYINTKEQSQIKRVDRLRKIFRLIEKQNIIIDEDLKATVRNFLIECGYHISGFRFVLTTKLQNKLGINIKEQLVIWLSKYQQLLKVQLFDEISPNTYLQISEPDNKFLQEFAKTSGILKVYLSSLFANSLYITNSSNLLSIYFKIQNINMNLYQSHVKFIFQNSNEALNLLLASYKVHTDPFKRQRLMVRNLREFYLDSINEQLSRIIIHLPVKEKFNLIIEFSSHIQRILHLQNSLINFSFSIHIAKMASYLCKKTNVGFSIMQANKEVIFKVVKFLLSKFKKDNQSPKGILMGSEICKFALKMREQNKNGQEQFIKVSDHHFSQMVHTLFIDKFFGFFKAISNQNRPQFTLDNKSYRGKKIVEKIKEKGKLFLLRLIINFMKEGEQNAEIGIKLAEVVLQKRDNPMNHGNSDDEIENQADHQEVIQIPEAYKYDAVAVQNQNDANQNDRQFAELSQVIFNLRSQLKHKSLIRIYQSLCESIKTEQISKDVYAKALQSLFIEIQSNMKQESIKKEQLQKSLQWVQSLSKLTKKLSLSLTHVINEDFINLFVKNIINLTQAENTNKKMLLNSLYILQRFIPNRFTTESKQFTSYLETLLRLLIKIVQINNNQQIDSNIIESVAYKLINNNYSSDKIIKIFIQTSIAQGKYVQVINAIHKLIEKQQIEKMEMEAHLKAHFLKIEENIASEEATVLTSKLKDFVDSFKIRYKDNIQQFKDVAEVFIRKIQQKSNENSASNISFIFDRKHKLWFSEFGKTSFADYKPNRIITLALKRLCEKLQSMKDNSQVDELQNIRQQAKVGLLEPLKQLIYAHPLLLPQLLKQQISKGEVMLSFTNLIIQKISEEKSSSNLSKILDFAFYLGLDHSAMIKSKSKTIFFSEYFFYMILKQISQMPLTKNLLIFILYMIQLKKFNRLCTLRSDDETDSLKQLLERKLVELKGVDDENEQKVNSQIICEILFYIYKYEEIYLLRNSYIAVNNKDEEGHIVNQCLIPFKAIFFDEDESITIKRNQAIQSLNKDSEIQPWLRNQPTLTDIYGQILRTNQNSIIENGEVHEQAFQFVSIPQEYLKMLESKPQNESTLPKMLKLVTFTNSNEAFKRRANRLINSIQGNQIFDEQLGDRAMIARQQLGLPHNRNQRRRRQVTSRYAPEQFRSSEMREADDNPADKIIQSFKQIPEQQQEEELISLHRSYSYNMAQSKDRAIQRQEEEINNLVVQINNYRAYLTDQEEFNIEEISQVKPFTEKKQELTKILAEDEFRYRLQYCGEDIQDIIEDFKAKGCLKYLSKFNDYIEPFYLRLQTKKLYKRFSTESIDSDVSRKTNEIIDNLIIKESKKGLSKKSSISSESQQSLNQLEQIQELNLGAFQSTNVKDYVFPQFNEKIAMEIISMLYQTCNTHFSQLCIIPLLQNKKIQDKVINTLIYILRNPINTTTFPKQVKVWDRRQQKWIQQSKSESKNIISKKILKMFDWVRHFCYYRNPEFLKSQISYDGLCGLVLQPRQDFDSFFPINYHEPFAELIEYSLSYNHELAASLLLSASHLPIVIMKKIINVIKQPQAPNNSRNRRNRKKQNNHGIFGNQQQKVRICEVLFNSLKGISQNQDFKKLFYEEFPLGVKQPRLDVLSELLETELYSKEDLKEKHLKTLQKCKLENKCSQEQLIFLNKIFKIYSDDDLSKATVLAQYHDIHSKVLNQLNKNKLKIEKQPIIKLLKHPELLNFLIKEKFFYNSVNPTINNQFMIYEANQNTIKAERKNGVFYSAFQQLRNKPDSFWKAPLTVQFFDNDGKLEQNGGPGIPRQWYTTITKEMILQREGLFQLTPGNVYFFSKNCLANALHLQYFEFIGKIVGLSLISPTYYITPSLSPLLYKILLDEKIELNDIAGHYKTTDFEEMNGYLDRMLAIQDEAYFEGFTFTWQRKKLISAEQFHSNHYLPNEENVGNYIKEYIELKPNGANIPLTLENVHEYVELRKQQYIKSILEGLEKPIEAFKSGISHIIKLDKLKLFTSYELRRVIEGDCYIDMQQLRRDVRFTGKTQNNIRQWFFQIVDGLSQMQRSTLLEYWNASPKIHPDGIVATGLQIYINENKTPFSLIGAQTCSHLLILAEYSTKELLTERLMRTMELFQQGQIRQFDFH